MLQLSLCMRADGGGEEREQEREFRYKITVPSVHESKNFNSPKRVDGKGNWHQSCKTEVFFYTLNLMGNYRESTDPIISFSTFWGRRNTPLVNTLISYNSTLFIFLCFTTNPFGFHHDVPLIKTIFGSSIILEPLKDFL